MPPPAVKLKLVLFPALVEFAPISHAVDFCSVACDVVLEPICNKFPATPDKLKALKMVVVPAVN